MTQPTYPKTIAFLSQAARGGSSQDLALALEITALVKELRANSDRIAELEAAVLRAEPSPLTAFPTDFYVYGADPLTYRPTDDVVQDMVNEVVDTVLEDDQYTDLTDGDTLVLKLRYNGVEKIIVTRGYFELVLQNDSDEKGGFSF